jgi:hydroxymethylglutaryl-CoA reductase (NADPH)
MTDTPKIPRDPDDDYAASAAAARRDYVRKQTGVDLHHVGQHSFDPSPALHGNVEHFTGVAQVPIGLAGPLLVNGEHAQGEFLVPLATTEGTLVASYNRGMKLLRESGGVTVTVVEDHMQRAPAFLFESARDAKAFIAWFDDHLDTIREKAQSTTSTGKLVEVERYQASRFVYTRFNYTTGDAAGQNMTGKATWAACEWIKAQRPCNLTDYILESQLATDKKHSQINTLRTRGKRVIAEALIPDAKLQEIMKVSSAQVYRARQIAMLGGTMSGVANNGAHSANGLTAMFIATGQDVANIAESHAALVYAERRENGDYYYSITIPSLIIATYGGGTGLPTQRECLELLGCYGSGKVNKLAEIMAAVVVCGELSLGSAIVADEWVSSHDAYGRNR